MKPIEYATFAKISVMSIIIFSCVIQMILNTKDEVYYILLYHKPNITKVD